MPSFSACNRMRGNHSFARESLNRGRVKFEIISRFYRINKYFRRSEGFCSKDPGRIAGIHSGKIWHKYLLDLALGPENPARWIARLNSEFGPHGMRKNSLAPLPPRSMCRTALEFGQMRPQSLALVICFPGGIGRLQQLSSRGTVVQRDQQMRCGAAVMSNEFDMESEWITELGKVRSDEYTEKILAFIQELEKSAPEPFLPLLTDLALARTLIVHLVIRYGPERGMAEARDAFESTLEQMKPLLERMKSRKGPPPQ
ncbi:MAG: hypothetical protein WBG54_23290 [Acidobacteriaceae bacterium]